MPTRSVRSHPRFHLPPFVTLALAILAPYVHGQSNENWSATFAHPLPGVDGIVNDALWYDGHLYVTGDFDAAGGARARNVARWTGSAWEPLGDGIAGAGWAIAEFNGAIVVAGRFYTAGGIPAVGVATWDGAAWQSMDGGVNFPPVRTLAVHDGRLIAGGNFTQAGGVSAQGIAAWDGESWSPLAGGLASAPDAITSWNGAIVAGGYHYLHRWDGNAWSPLATTLQGDVGALCSFGGDLIVGGAFSSVNSLPIANLARWNGAAWSPVGNTPDNVVFDVAAAGTSLYIGGAFTHIGAENLTRVARWDGSAWSGLASGCDDHVSAICAHPEGVVASGYFQSAGGIPVGAVATWDGASWSAIGSGGQGLLGRVTSQVFYQGDLYVGGNISQAGELPVSGIARWDGGSWSALGSGVDGVVEAMAVHDGHLYVGGNFTGAGGVDSPNLARWNGTSWNEAPGGGAAAPVYALLSHGGSLYAAGLFSQIGGTAATRVARLDLAGWHALGEGLKGMFMGSNQAAGSALAAHGADVIVSGRFDRAGPVSAANIARWNGASWSALGNGLGGSFGSGGDEVTELASFAGRLVVGGSFFNSGSQYISCLAEWNGVSWSAVGGGVDAPVTAISVTPDGRVVAGGMFGWAGGLPFDHLALWDGANWSTLGTGIGPGGGAMPPVESICQHAYGIYFGGSIRVAGDVGSSRIAHWTWNIAAAPNAAPTPRLTLDASVPYRLGTVIRLRNVEALRVGGGDRDLQSLRLDIFDASGKCVARQEQGRAGEWRWDGRTESGAKASSGLYFARVSPSGVGPAQDASTRLLLIR